MIDPIASQERLSFRRRRQPEPRHGCMPCLGMKVDEEVNEQSKPGDENRGLQDPSPESCHAHQNTMCVSNYHLSVR